MTRPYYDHAGITIYHGDARELLQRLSADVIISDPPYGDQATHKHHLASQKILQRAGGRRALGFDGISEAACVDLARAWCAAVPRWVVFTCEWKYLHALDAAGLLVRFGVWRKPDGAPQFTGDRPGMGWEAIAICHRRGRKRWNGGGRHAFYEHPKGRTQTGHPTQKPIGLYLDFVGDFSDPGETVLDPFMGSGTTLVAARRLGRRAIGIEQNERYCEIAAKRLAQQTLPIEIGVRAEQVALFGCRPD